MNADADPDGHPFRAEASSDRASVPSAGITSRSDLLVWGAAGLAAALGSLALARSMPLDGRGRVEVCGWILATLGWTVALRVAPRVRGGWRVGLVLVVLSLAVRAPWCTSDPRLSDDVERYVWEGGLVGAGIDVTRVPPDSAALAVFRVQWGDLWERVAHREVPAAYPPLTLLAHSAVVSLAGGARHGDAARAALRWTYGLCDLGVLAALLWLLRRRGLPAARACAWGWSPLVALEFLGAGHVDALAIAMLVVALALATEIDRRRGAVDAALGALLALGALAKLLPAVLLPFVARGRRRGLLLAGALGSTAIVLGGYALQVGSLPRATGLGQYALRWESFSLVFRWVEPLFGGARDESWSDPRRLARAAVALIWLAVAALAWRRRLEPARAAWWMVGALLVLTPTLHPWYLTWIVPLLALRRSLAWTWLLAVAPLLYWPVPRWRTELVWHEPTWLWPLVALPFLVLLTREALPVLRGRAP